MAELDDRFQAFPTSGRGLVPVGWDELPGRAGAHLLQSRSWAEFQHDRGQHVIWERGEGWSWVALLRRKGPLDHLDCQLGPTVTGATALAGALASLRDAARREGAAYVRLEPVGPVRVEDMLAQGLAPAPAGASPRHHITSLVDLTLDERDLLARCSRNHRRAIEAAGKRGVVCREGQGQSDVDHFLAMIHETSRRGRWRASSDDYFRALLPSLNRTGGGKLYLAEVEGVPVAGRIVLISGSRWYDGFAGSHEQLNRTSRAGTALVWHVLLAGKAAGAGSFDFWGVSPLEEASHPWSGFSRFKRAFGGEDVERVGTWLMPVHRPRYLVQRFLWRGKSEAKRGLGLLRAAREARQGRPQPAGVS